MKPQKIKEDIFWVGAVDWDRRLFDSLIQLPDNIFKKHKELNIV